MTSFLLRFVRVKVANNPIADLWVPDIYMVVTFAREKCIDDGHEISLKRHLVDLPRAVFIFDHDDNRRISRVTSQSQRLIDLNWESVAIRLGSIEADM